MTAADPQTLARISRLELRARSVVEGVLSGLHRSPHRGSSVEFAQHRDYVPGDEIRHIDWKVYARSDRFHIKQFEEETNLRATLALDASTSMEYRGERSALSKKEYAAICAAALASLFLRQRDPVGLAIFDEGVRQFLPVSSTPAHLRTLMQSMEKAESKPKTGLGNTLHDLAERMKRRSMALIFSDFLDDPNDILRGLQHFHHKRHDMVLFHVLDRDEIEFPFKDAARFEGMEGEDAVLLEPNALRKQYQQALQEFTERLKKGCLELNYDYVLLPTDEPADTALARYLAQRSIRNK